ncbi:uncharacterized protein Eint_071110 [Encephalitozoon intestinalis ATCC 50506]|uniref:Uncharacterized protein n=1 Tax=Encephalitozoon intestinalis (strain ATCC 50506) TaxID=876142 RepID=E0S839_ENCIT|nr:uncharacterized protein Eint_071110 [Encephalitozoon intestinalis ATCC 50506]ADM11874.1 hypothetical protein Eint_071110 [Encephalitozoon intestinalis ATCC 50506]UTX45630.1 hypothetical protein GPK93_07g11950 [Encephalitozoon intestinalis]
MIRLKEQATFGKIYQIRYRDRMLLKRLREITVIQTYGIRMEGSITCTNEGDLLRILRSLAPKKKDIAILSPSTLIINEEIYKMFRILNAAGISLFLFVLQDNPVWYIDEVL